MLTGVDLIGLDGLVLFGTLIVLLATRIAVRRNRAILSAAGAAGGPPPARLPRLGDAVWPRLGDPRTALPVLAGSLLLVMLGQRAFAQGTSSAALLAVWLIGLGGVGLVTQATRALPRWDLPECALRPIALGRPAILPLGLALGGAAVAWSMQRERPPEAGHGDIVVVWLGSIALVLAAAIAPGMPGRRAGLRRWWRDNRAEAGLVAGTTLLAAIPLMVRLDTYPWVFNGDEGQFALSARDVLDGAIRNPFGVGFQAHPSLYFYLQAASLWLMGDDVAGARAFAALFGVLCVPMAYLLARRVSGGDRAVALAAALLVGSFHVHLFWSRDAQNNVVAVFFVLAVLYLLDRSRTGGAGASLLTGLALGLSQYFYVGARILPLVIAVTFGVWALVAIRQGASWAATLVGAGMRLALIAAGFVVAFAPLYAHYRTYPRDFWARIDTVSIFATGWYDERTREMGESGFLVLREQFWQSALLPFRTVPAGHYRGDPPFAGWPVALLGAVGLAVLTMQWWRPRATGAVVAYWGMVIGVALTVEPAQTSRSVAVVVLLCVFGAVGLGALTGVVRRTTPVPVWALGGAIAAIVLISAGWSLHFYFRDANQVALYSDPNTQVSEHMAREILATDRAATVYFLGSPRMYYDGFSNLVFRTPGVTAVDLEPLTAAGARPAITGTTIFIALPERAAELDVVRGWFPGGVEHETEQDGELLYVSYTVTPPAG